MSVAQNQERGTKTVVNGIRTICGPTSGGLPHSSQPEHGTKSIENFGRTKCPRGYRAAVFSPAGSALSRCSPPAYLASRAVKSRARIASESSRSFWLGLMKTVTAAPDVTRLSTATQPDKPLMKSSACSLISLGAAARSAMSSSIALFSPELSAMSSRMRCSPLPRGGAGDGIVHVLAPAKKAYRFTSHPKTARQPPAHPLPLPPRRRLC